MTNSPAGHEHGCPSEGTLRRVSSGLGTPGEQALVEEHLNECTFCQDRYDGLYLDDEAVRRVSHEYRASTSQTPARTLFWANPAGGGLGPRPEQPELIANGGPEVGNSSRWSSSRFRGYQLGAPLGRGGMGVVLKAFDPVLQRHVALKIISERLAQNEVARRRFLREARAAARLSHPAIVHVYSVDIDNDPPFLTMEYIRGRSLASRICEEAPLPARASSEIVRQVLSGLERAHEEGIIHRDVKPSNILIQERDAHVKLADFGLARGVGDVMRCTGEGQRLGTPWYMSPEQAEGRSDLDGRCDLYSIGVVLFEMLTGELPFPGRDPEQVIRDVMAKPLPDPQRFYPEIPETLAQVVRRATDKSLTGRYPSARAFIEALDEFLGSESAVASSREPTPTPGPEVGNPVASQLLRLTQSLSDFEGRIWAQTPGVTPTRDIVTSARDRASCFRVGDSFALHAFADRDCYLTLVDIGTSGRVSLLLCGLPLIANRAVTLAGPDASTAWFVGGPPGTELIKAFFTVQPLTLFPGVEQFEPLVPKPSTRDILCRLQDAGTTLESMTPDSWTDACLRFEVVQ